jgi:ABC-2 type transport system permease protein
MTHLLRAELLKVLTLRASYLALGVTVIAAAGLTALITHTVATGETDLTARREVLTLAGTSVAPAMALLLAMLVVGSEFRHNTITPALLITPNRRRLFLAKAGVSAAVGVVVALLAILFGWAGGAVTLAAVGSRPLLDTGDLGSLTAASVGVSVLYSLAGTSIATWLRNPTTALIVVLSALYVVDPLASLAIPARWMPGGATELIAHATVAAHPAWPWAAVAVLAGYAAVLAVTSLRFAAPRDLS